MDKTKSPAAYTKKWLNRNKQYWHEQKVMNHFLIIVIDKDDAPNIVKKHVEKINCKRTGFTADQIDMAEELHIEFD